jgi:hypothetical protein
MADTMQPVDFDPATVLRQKREKLGAAFAVGVIYPLIFFYSNDADRANLFVFSLLLLTTTAVVFASWKSTFLLNAMAVLLILPGFFVGTCIAVIIYHPDKANMFPIAAAIWTIIAIVPIILGSILGPLVRKSYP